VARPHIYPEEFRREACELVRRGDRSQRQIAADLGIPDQTLNNWMKAESRAKVRAKDPNALTESELAELKRLRKENTDLRTDREILYKAAAFSIWPWRPAIVRTGRCLAKNFFSVWWKRSTFPQVWGW
jgi:transposase